MNITEDEFAAWREHPITSHIFDTVLAGEIKKARDHWMQVSWERGNPDPMILVRMTERARAVHELLTLNLHDITEGLIDH